ncbi:MAG: hypothetical protein J0H94_04385 [Rhizobiales bacterium]|nr:hypothetical protein [Hyphomicrobiales bacterium]
MALDKISGLKSSIASWLARTGDSNITGAIPDFITLAEARLNRVLRLRTQKQDAPLIGTPGSRYLDLPTDFREAIALYLTTFGDQWRLSPRMAGTLDLSDEAGTPVIWMVNGSRIELDIPCDRAHTFLFRYRSKFALNQDDPNATNWLLSEHPDAYLAASLVEAYSFMKAMDKASTWEGRLQQTLAEIGDENDEAEGDVELEIDPSLPRLNWYC